MEKIFLIGFMGAGKSTVGRELALILGWNFIDIDKVIENKVGKTITDIFSEYGEIFFRVEEKEVLHELLSQQKVVIAAGGGIPIFFDNLNIMKKSGFVVYLFVNKDVIKKRLKLEEEHSKRPLAVNAKLDNLIQSREPFYRRAHFTIDCSELSPLEIAHKIKGVYKKWKK